MQFEPIPPFPNSSPGQMTGSGTVRNNETASDMPVRLSTSNLTTPAAGEPSVTSRDVKNATTGTGIELGQVRQVATGVAEQINSASTSSNAETTSTKRQFDNFSHEVYAPRGEDSKFALRALNDSPRKYLIASYEGGDDPHNETEAIRDYVRDHYLLLFGETQASEIALDTGIDISLIPEGEFHESVINNFDHLRTNTGTQITSPRSTQSVDMIPRISPSQIANEVDIYSYDQFVENLTMMAYLLERIKPIFGDRNNIDPSTGFPVPGLYVPSYITDSIPPDFCMTIDSQYLLQSSGTNLHTVAYDQRVNDLVRLCNDINLFFEEKFWDKKDFFDFENPGFNERKNAGQALTLTYDEIKDITGKEWKDFDVIERFDFQQKYRKLSPSVSKRVRMLETYLRRITLAVKFINGEKYPTSQVSDDVNDPSLLTPPRYKGDKTSWCRDFSADQHIEGVFRTDLTLDPQVLGTLDETVHLVESKDKEGHISEDSFYIHLGDMYEAGQRLRNEPN